MQGPLLDQLPASIAAIVSRHWQDLLAATDSSVQQSLAKWPDELWQQLTTTFAGSDYAANLCCRHPQWLTSLPDALQPEPDYADELAQCLGEVTREEELHQQLRLFRHRHMLRIIWRDLNRLSDMNDTTRDLSLMADACIDGALNWLYQHFIPQWGTPYSRDSEAGPGQPQQLVVIGMGKLGAGELNLSSDIDLIFCYPENGETRDGRKCMDNQTFFNRLGQKLIQALDINTADGFAFRVDMRLRPYGKSGILSPSFAAMEEYYQDQGRDWERYALIKARVVAGDKINGQQLMLDLRPFVFRKYLDFSAFESLRDMKAMINREVRRRSLYQNVKLGPGGIREVEFIGQAFQLIRGGRDTRLQARELQTILKLLPETVGMPQQAVDELIEAYHFLRNSEHAIQAVADQQTQELPTDEVPRLRMALAMGFTDWESFYQCLQEHRDRVSQHFAEVVAPAGESTEQEQANSLWVAIWQGQYEDDQALQSLSEHGHEDAPKALKLITDLRESRKVVTQQAIGRERLNKLMPLLLETLTHQQQPTETLARSLHLVESVLRRSAYLLLLTENPNALAQLVRLCAASPWISDQLARQPILLDELLDVASLYHPPDRDALESELRQLLLRIPEDDTEQLMNGLRYFKNAHVLQVAAAEISGVLPLMKVSDYLTFIAEVVLQGALNIAWRMMTQKHGYPLRADGSRCDPDFIIVGYGKVGGIELSYGSDLDLVFIHDAAPNQDTDGDKALDSQVFFTRLGQRIIHLLNTATTSGQLYEVDMRLRPSGASGLLVSSLKAFSEYQNKEAWTWEHQALVRARVIAGSPALKERFEAVRAQVLGQPRKLTELRQSVIEMRQKMRTHLGSKLSADLDPFSAEAEFQLKQDPGGIVDIEFLVQFGVLAYSHQYPELLAYTDNIRLLETIEQLELISPEDALLLREAYKALRTLAHRQALQNQSSSVPGNTLTPYRLAVTRIWQQWIEKTDNP